MSDGGKGDLRRPLTVPEKQFNDNWETVFGKKTKMEEPIPFAGMVEIEEDDVPKRS